MPWVVGIDEVGRGAVAGPVYLGFVALDPNYPKLVHYWHKHDFPTEYKCLEIVRDSKKLSPKNRQVVYQLIKDFKITNLVLSANNILICKYGIETCLSHLFILGLSQTISLNKKNDWEILADGRLGLPINLNIKILEEISVENLNILQINRNQISKLISKIKKIYSYVNSNKKLRFGLFGPKIQIKNENKADDKYLAIALASNLAKVSRDKYMSELGLDYPEFQWHKNKGYATSHNLNTIKMNLNNKYLRWTWLKNIYPKSNI